MPESEVQMDGVQEEGVGEQGRGQGGRVGRDRRVRAEEREIVTPFDARVSRLSYIFILDRLDNDFISSLC